MKRGFNSNLVGFEVRDHRRARAKLRKAGVI